MFNIILACDKNNGIGKDNEMPWFFTSDMRYFKNKTTPNNFFEKSIVIMGRKTMESIPKNNLPDRINIVISNTLDKSQNNNIIVNSFTEALDEAYKYNGEVWVIGGSSIYELAFNHPDLNKVYITKINKNYNCDRFVKLPKLLLEKSYKIEEKDININEKVLLEFNTYSVDYSAEQQYLQLLNDIYKNGENRDCRNGKVLSKFSKELNFDVSENFPLLTTKKMFWRGIVEELLFFIRGDTDTTKLSEKGIKIWEGNTSKEFLKNLNLNYNEGEMGPMYGYQWRFFNKPYKSEKGGIDQLKNLIDDIKNNPNSRRLLMTDYNPSQVKEGVLYPCHSLILQFNVENDKLSVKMYQRSADLFLGLPFNIASTSLLLYIICKLTNLKPNRVSITLGDCHIYKEHLEQVGKQLNRQPYSLPKLKIPDFKNLEEVEKSKFEDYIIEDYNCHSGLKAQMIA